MTALGAAALGLLGTAAAMAALLGERRWRRGLASARFLLVVALATWAPAAILAAAQAEMPDLNTIGAEIQTHLLPNTAPTSTPASTTTTTP